MRSFQQVIVLLFALMAFAFADDTSYVATTTLTSTIQVVLTATVPSGGATTPAAATTPIYSVPSNSTLAYPTGTAAPTTSSTGPSPTISDFPGAAAGLSANSAFLAAAAAVLGYLAL